MDAFIQLATIVQHADMYNRSVLKQDFVFNTWSSDVTIHSKNNACTLIFVPLGKTLIICVTSIGKLAVDGDGLIEYVKSELAEEVHKEVEKHIDAQNTFRLSISSLDDSRTSPQFCARTLDTSSKSPIRSTNDSGATRFASVISMVKLRINSGRMLKVHKFASSFFESFDKSCVILTGHAYGGACAQYLARALSNKHGEGLVVKCVTFGTPIVFDDAFYQSYNKTIRRSYNFFIYNDVAIDSKKRTKGAQEQCILAYEDQRGCCMCLPLRRSYRVDDYLRALQDLSMDTMNGVENNYVYCMVSDSNSSSRIKDSPGSSQSFSSPDK